MSGIILVFFIRKVVVTHLKGLKNLLVVLEAFQVCARVHGTLFGVVGRGGIASSLEPEVFAGVRYLFGCFEEDPGKKKLDLFS